MPSWFESVDRYYSSILGGTLEALRPGEIAVVRSDARAEEERGMTVPVWILVSGGRSIVSTSRFLMRVTEAWAENFAAPEYLLREEFLGDLRDDVARSMDSEIMILRSRIFIPAPKRMRNGPPVRLIDLGPGRGHDPAKSLSRAEAEGWFPVFRCSDTDRYSVRCALGAGCVEYGRTIRFLAER